MPISFSNIPANVKMPLYYVEVDPSMAGLPVLTQKALLVGIKLTTGATAAVNVPLPIGSQAQADAAFGAGSHLALMFKTFFANNWGTQVVGLPVAEGSTAATGTVVLTATAVQAGTYHLYIAGTHVPVGVVAGMTASQIGDAVVAAVTGTMKNDLPVTATNSAGTVTFTAKWKGVSGNDIRLEDNYYGAIGGQIMPPGLGATYTQPAGGAGDPSWAAAITALGEEAYDFVALPFTDSTTLVQWDVEYGFTDAGRWGYIRQLYGTIFSAKRDTYANLLTFSNTQNSGVVSIMAVEPTAPAPVWAWSAAYTAKAARALINDPARPLQSLHLESIVPAKADDRWNFQELNSFALNGLATQRTLTGEATPVIARETTSYLRNLYGVSDDAYELVTTMHTLTKVIRNQRHAITSKFPRHKLANDGTRFGAGQAIVTPKIVKAELIAQYRIDEFNGLVEDATNFKRHLIVERDPNDPNRLNVLYPPDLVNQLRVFAVLAQFRLQYDRGVDLEIIGDTAPAV